MHTRKHFGKTVKHPYTKDKAIDSACRCRGSCSYCKDTRTYKNRKQKQAAAQHEAETWEMIAEIVLGEKHSLFKELSKL